MDNISGDIKNILIAIKASTVTISDHPDPKSVDDCWKEVFEQLAQKDKEIEVLYKKVNDLEYERSNIKNANDKIGNEDYENKFVKRHLSAITDWREAAIKGYEQDDKIGKAIEWCDEKSKEAKAASKVHGGSIVYGSQFLAFEEMKQFLVSLQSK